jgi:hypothetical protein
LLVALENLRPGREQAFQLRIKGRRYQGVFEALSTDWW